eukprot:624082-Hanusia_phi.AAC.11
MISGFTLSTSHPSTCLLFRDFPLLLHAPPPLPPPPVLRCPPPLSPCAHRWQTRHLPVGSSRSCTRALPCSRSSRKRLRRSPAPERHPPRTSSGPPPCSRSPGSSPAPCSVGRLAAGWGRACSCRGPAAGELACAPRARAPVELELREGRAPLVGLQTFAAPTPAPHTGVSREEGWRTRLLADLSVLDSHPGH